MSRSYKKIPGWPKRRKSSGNRWAKRYTSKLVRNYREDISNGNWYRHIWEWWIRADRTAIFTKKKLKKVAERKDDEYKFWMK